MSELILRTRELTRRYGRTLALDRASLSVEKGQILGLVGRNGAGKTTLIRLISGQSRPTSGELALFGASSPSALDRARSRTGVMVETPAFYPYLTAEQNLEYYRIQRGIPGRSCVDEALELVRLTGAGKKKFKTFSLGMKQRLGLALALMNQPEFLLLDEPINGLDPEGIVEFRELLLQLNRERQNIEGEIFQECIQRLDHQPQQGAIVLADPEWHQGVVGIVASRLSEKYTCPTFMICLDQGMGKGSCRSWGGINLFELLMTCGDLLESFGGHALAAGFMVREENIPALAQRLRQGVLEQQAGQEPPSVLETDGIVQPQQLDVASVEALDALEPCGTGNPRPVLVITGAHVQSAVQVGRGRHLKLRLEARGSVLDAIFFSADAAQLGVTPGCRVDVAFYPQINEFRGVRSVQLQVVDLHPALTRAQMERCIYDKYRRGELLSPDEAQSLLPDRAEFVCLWRYLEHQSGPGDCLEDTLARMTRSVAHSSGRRERPNHTRICLEVMQERGLISLKVQSGRVHITLHRLEHKVDLEASEILRRLRAALQE